MSHIGWLSGLLEGEGCFTAVKSGSSGRYTTPAVVLAMTDLDVVIRAHKLMARIGQREVQISHRRLKSRKIVHSVYLTGLPAVKIMCRIRNEMGQRRGRMIDKIIADWHPKKYQAARQFKQSLR